MKISVDGGGLTTKKNKRFGNYYFAKNLVLAFQKYDKKNKYFIYGFEKKPFSIKSKNIFFKRLLPKFRWLKIRVSLEELINRKDVFLAFNQAIPFFTKKTISFSHGLSFYFYPEFYPDSFLQMKKQLEEMIKKSSKIILSSRKVSKELVKIYPRAEEKIKIIPFGIPFDMEKTKKLKREKYFLFVGMEHNIKNIPFLVKAFRKFKKDYRFFDYQLFLISGKEIRNQEEGIFWKKVNNRSQLKKMYQKATAYLTASRYESFNLPVLEALSQDCPVIGLKSAIIPEMKKFVFVKGDIDDFVAQMKKVTMGDKKKIDHRELRNIFSWKKYFRELKDLYQE